MSKTASIKKELSDILCILEGHEKIKYKYNEDQILLKFINHIQDTYKAHYMLSEGGKQVLDVIEEIDPSYARTYCITNAIKYISRYGKKDGKNLKDLLKAMHCIALLMHYDHYKTNG